ncbi:MAG: response regulator [Acidobacteriota bacterium]
MEKKTFERTLILTFQIPSRSGERVARSLGRGRRVCPWTPDSDWNLLDRDDVSSLILSDAGLPNSVCAWIRRLRHRAPDLPVIFLADRHTRELEVQVRQAGIHYYLHEAALEAELPLLLGALERRSGALGSEPVLAGAEGVTAGSGGHE